MCSSWVISQQQRQTESFPEDEAQADGGFEERQAQSRQRRREQTEREAIDGVERQRVGRAQAGPELECSEPQEHEPDADPQQDDAAICKEACDAAIEFGEAFAVHDKTVGTRAQYR